MDGKNRVDISVVINTFNGAATLSSAIQSVVEQSSPPAELLIVDDGSTDDTERIVASYTDRVPWLQYIKKPHTQLADSRNFAIQRATGSHVAFIDADDLWSPDYLLEVANAFEKCPAAELLAVNGLAVRSNGDVIRTIFPVDAPPLCGEIADVKTLFDFFSYTIPSGTVMTRALYDRVGPFSLDFPLLGHDWDWLIRAVDGGAYVTRLDLGLMLYRTFDDNLTKAYDVGFESWLRLLPTISRRWRDQPEFAECARSLSRRMYAPLLTYPRQRVTPLIDHALQVLPEDDRLRLLRVAHAVGSRPFRFARSLVRYSRNFRRPKAKLDMNAPLGELFAQCSAVTARLRDQSRQPKNRNRAEVRDGLRL